MIVPTKRGFQVVSHTGKPLSKNNLSREAAEARLAQVERFKRYTRSLHRKHNAALERKG